MILCTFFNDAYPEKLGNEFAQCWAPLGEHRGRIVSKGNRVQKGCLMLPKTNRSSFLIVPVAFRRGNLGLSGHILIIVPYPP